MGYWKMKNDEAIILLTDGREANGLWGDQPADIMADAVAAIIETFERDAGRKPTKSEIEFGLKFHLNICDQLEP